MFILINGGYNSLINTISLQQPYLYYNVVFGHNTLYSMGFLEYSGPKAGDREAVTGSEVFYGDWWE